MKVIIAGSREIADYNLVKTAIEQSGFEITEVVSGRCDGVDLLGERWAKENDIPIEPFPADWMRLHRAAGPIRNQQMADYADALIAIPIKGSKGTSDMIRKARKGGLKVYIHYGVRQ